MDIELQEGPSSSKAAAGPSSAPGEAPSSMEGDAGPLASASADQPLDEEPLYVNAKQYYRILKRRVARARLEELHRLSRQRKVSSYSLFIMDCLLASPRCFFVFFVSLLRLYFFSALPRLC